MTAGGGQTSWQLCEACGSRSGELDAWIRCRACGGLLRLEHAAPPLQGEALRRLFDRPDPSGVWRFREVVLPGVTGGVVSYPEGNTPLVVREQVAVWAGMVGGDLAFKHEGLNPTGSFKDRGMTVALTQARRLGVRAVACASTGNTSASLAAYAGHAGLPALVLVPAGRVALGKLAQTLRYGALVLAVRGDFDACLRLLEESAEALSLYLVNSVNPFRIEGQKTIVLELLAQRGWVPPDWIVLPGGNLGNTAAFGKALREARALGLITRLPRLAVVQAEGAAPFARGFRDGFRQRVRVEAETSASAIRIGDPASWDRAVQAIRETEGVVLSVPDSEIMAAKEVLDRAGVGCEPASAASLAGLRRLAGTGTVSAAHSVVAVLTGHLLKDPGPAPPDAVQEVDASVAALERAVEGARERRAILPQER